MAAASASTTRAKSWNIFPSICSISARLGSTGSSTTVECYWRGPGPAVANRPRAGYIQPAPFNAGPFNRAERRRSPGKGPATMALWARSSASCDPRGRLAA